MCRFLIIKSKIKFNPQNFLNSFSTTCEKSVAPDGERQRDGYGVAWHENGIWKAKKSLVPIWEAENACVNIPETNLLVVHARGAGFEKDRGIIDYNEPFIDGDLCFVFNGLVKGVKIKRRLEGEIGSQKLFSLIKEELKNKNLNSVLKFVKKLMLNNSGKIEGMNIGLIKGDEIAVLCQYSDNAKYYSLHFYQAPDLLLVSSEPFGNYDWKKFKKGEVKTFNG